MSKPFWTADHHLAQLNIGRTAYEKEDPRLADFMNNLERINALAERSPGFVWRLQGENRNATEIPVTEDDPRVISNLSVWENPDALEHFTFNTVHKAFYRRRGEWFQPASEAHFVMWRITPGHRPPLAEGLERLEHLRAHGPSERAFGWESLPRAEQLRAQRCA